jgi:hypothetical protein
VNPAARGNCWGANRPCDFRAWVGVIPLIQRLSLCESITANMFLTRLGQLFPDIEKEEFRDACTRLARQMAIELAFPSIGGYRNYQGAADDEELFRGKTVLLKRASLSEVHFRQLSALIETPFGFKPHGLRRL